MVSLELQTLYCSAYIGSTPSNSASTSLQFCLYQIFGILLNDPKVAAALVKGRSRR